MNVIYVITTQGGDYYSAITRISVASLRITNPRIRVILACDSESFHNMRRSSDRLFEDIDDCIVCDTPEGPPPFRNRFVKTKIRLLADGRFLFLDSDILVRKDISQLFSITADVAAARNHSRYELPGQICKTDKQMISELQWEAGAGIYFNGGVVFFNDTDRCRQWSRRWHRNWLTSWEKTGTHRDQPSLNVSLHQIKPEISVLNNTFNAQLCEEPRTVKGAHIWHYYATQKLMITRFATLAGRIAAGQELAGSDVQDIIRAGHPWNRSSFIDDIIARRVIAAGRMSRWQELWFEREFKQSIRALMPF
jgi:hypothetical protein